MIVSNSTVIIFLAKINKLDLLKSMFNSVLIPEAVKNEAVDEGKKKNYIDAMQIEKAINDGWIKAEPVQIENIVDNLNIDKGEAEAISLAHQKKLKLLMDQTHAREAAKLLNLQPRGTLYVLFLALSKKLIDYDEYLKLLEELIGYGFRMSQEVYLEAVRMGKEINKK